MIRKMGKYILLVLLVLGCCYIWYIYPKAIFMNMEGTQYRLGDTSESFSKPVSIRIDGKLSKRIGGIHRFQGTINIDDEKLPIPEDDRKLDIKFDENGRGIMIYTGVEEGRIRMFSYGDLFISRDLKKISISKYENEETNSDQSRRGWNSGDGMMIAGPAEDRKTALEISKELMRPDLNGFILE
jgi:hypothetical protein